MRVYIFSSHNNLENSEENVYIIYNKKRVRNVKHFWLVTKIYVLSKCYNFYITTMNKNGVPIIYIASVGSITVVDLNDFKTSACTADLQTFNTTLSIDYHHKYIYYIINTTTICTL